MTPATPSAQQESQAIAQLLQQAVALHQAGQLLEAGQLYQAILQARPDHAEANHHLGVIAVQAQQPAAGLPYLMAALDADPTRGPYWLDYIDALHRAGQGDDARSVLTLARQQGLEGDEVEGGAARLESLPEKRPGPDVAPRKTGRTPTPARGESPSRRDVDALVAQFQAGRYPEVAVLARRMTERFPGFAPAWKILGIALQVLGREDEAVAPLQRASALMPVDADVHRRLGRVLHEQGRLDEADTHFQRALSIDPADAATWESRANVLAGLARAQEAEACYRKALQIVPDEARLHDGLGRLLHRTGQLDQAESCLRQALERCPDDMNVRNSLGLTLLARGLPEAAATCFRDVLQSRPDDVAAMNNLGQTLLSLGQLAEAEACFRRALQLKPDHATLHSNLLYHLTLNAPIEADAIFREHVAFGERFEAPFAAHWPPHIQVRDPERRLKIGFVSADFYNHAVASFVEPVLAHLANDAQFSLHAYYNNVVDDPVTQRLRGHFSQWHGVLGLSDAVLADTIRADGIDVLIDLSGHTAGNRLPVFARKPAPVQVSWIGYPGTTGLRAMDYYFADRFLLPPGPLDGQFTERIVRLPAIAPFMPFDAAPSVNDLPALANGYITFGSFNRPNKLSRQVVALWSRLLRSLPDSRMVLGAMPEQGQHDVLRAWFAEEGIDSHRLEFHPRSGMEHYLALHHRVDLCLDTFPYNGGTTTNHALWMGVPTLTLAGSSMPGRVGVANLSHVGLTDFVVQTQDDFVARGVHWAQHIPVLAELRQELRERALRSPLRNSSNIAKATGLALRLAWRHWCAGEPPQPFEVTLQDATETTRSQRA